jgi:hypothetical protein
MGESFPDADEPLDLAPVGTKGAGVIARKGGPHGNVDPQFETTYFIAILDLPAFSSSARAFAL